MPPGDATPFISQEEVRSALEHLIYTASEKPSSPLQWLLLVDEFLSNPDLPSAQHAREFGFNQILSTIIADELFRLRRLLGQPPLVPDADRQTVLTQLTADAAARSQELIAWDWLYCRYVRVDLNITPEIFSQAVYVDERTLRRYQQQATKRLTERLTTEEWAARVRQRQRRLRGELPGGGARVLIGRDELLARLETAVQTHAAPLMLTGAAGVGKTALVEVLIAQLIKTDMLDRLIWLSRPASIDFALHAVRERLLPEAGQLTLRDYAQVYRLIVVLDDVTHWQGKPEALQTLLDALSPALVILTSQAFIAVPGIAHVVVPELNESDAGTLLTKLLQANQYPEDAWPEAKIVWRLIGGNPLALLWFVHNLRFYGADTISAPSVHELFTRVTAQLNDSVKQTWFTFALWPPDIITPGEWQSMWPELTDTAAIPALLQRHLLESVPVQPDCFQMTTAARRYVENIYQTDEHNSRALMDALIRQLDQQLDRRCSRAYDVYEYVLVSDWLTLTPERRYRWIKALWREGFSRGRWAAWQTLLKPDRQHVTSDFDLLTGYGLCLRRVGEWSAAQSVFETVIVQEGRVGRFLDQARALLEMAITLRYQGQYELATTQVARAERAARQYHDESFLLNVKIEHAQISADRGDTRAAAAVLLPLPPSKRTLLLWSEVYLLTGEFERSRAAANQALTDYDHLPTDQARILVTMSRTYERTNDVKTALSYAGTALTLLETQDDPFALARAQSNLGALLAQAERWEEAHRLLTQAKEIQSRLRDHVGLTVTQHNLEHVQAHFAG